MRIPPPPPGVDLGESRKPAIFGALLSTYIIALVVMVLRIAARRLKRNPLWREDWLSFSSFVFATVHVFCTLGFMVPRGTGLHVWAGPPDALRSWALGFFVSEMVYTLSILTVKLSTLSFYWRIFGASPGVKMPIWVLTAVVAGWAIGVLCAAIFQCVPTQAFWQRFDPSAPLGPHQYRCHVEVKLFIVGNAIPNIITDAMIVLLPIPYVLHLHLPRAQRFALACIFAVGAFVTVISIVRLVFLMDIDLYSIDLTWNFAGAIMWTNLEVNIAVICCCLPSLKPILKLAVNGAARSSTARAGEPKYAETAPAHSYPNAGDPWSRCPPCSPRGDLFLGSAAGAHTTTIAMAGGGGGSGSHKARFDVRDVSLSSDGGGSSRGGHGMTGSGGSGVDLAGRPVARSGITVTTNFQVREDTVMGAEGPNGEVPR